MSGNPLLDYARVSEFSVRLPSNCQWYKDENIIDYTMNGEVAVFPMTPKDELMQMNPDALLSGDATIKLIESCVPSIKDAGKLFYCDANVLLLAIHKATYGNELKIPFVCPECHRKISELKDDDKSIKDGKTKEEKIKELKDKGQIKLEVQTISIDIDYLIGLETFLDSEYVYNTDNGLKIYYHPTRIKNKLEYELMQFNNKKIIDSYKDYNFKDFAYDEEKKKILNQINDLYIEMNSYGNKIIADSISKIVLPDGSYVDDYNQILEFISQSKSTMVNDLNSKILELNKIGIPSEIDYECECCHHEWKDKIIGFNAVDFFGNSSYM